MINKLIIVGNVGREPEMRFTPNGNPVTSFSVATNETYTDSSGERQKRTEWFNVVTWNKLAETCNEFLAKGMMVYAEGRLHLRTWEGQDGQTRYRNELTAQTVRFLSRKESIGESEPKEVTEAPETTEEEAPKKIPESQGELEPEDIPF